MAKATYRYGQPVLLKWGLSEVKGRIERVYDSGSTIELVVALDPEESGYIVDEPTTVAVPADQVRGIEPAA